MRTSWSPRPGAWVLVGLLGAGWLAGCSAEDAVAPPSSASSSASSGASPGAETPVERRRPETVRPNPGASRALQRAVVAGDVPGTRRALAAGADVEVRDGDRRTPLLLATRADRPVIARLLLDAGADPDARDAIHDSAFLYAGAEGRTEILRMILEKGADVRSTNRYGGTALIPASEHAHVDVVRMLLAAGVPVDHVNDLGWTALHEAIVLGNGDADHVTVVRLLLAAGADPTIPDGDGVAPRTLAAQRGFDEIVDLLDRHAAD